MASVRLFNAAIDEQDGVLILRGSIDPASLGELQVDGYQREEMPGTSKRKLHEAFERGDRIPDIELGMRGARTRDNGDKWSLLDPVFIIDGLQRVCAARDFVAAGGTPRLGAVVHINTTREMEVARFRILNIERSQLSSNVIVRNMAPDYPCIDALLRMTADDSEFALRRRVNWNQTPHREHLVTGVTLLKTASILHRYLGGGGGKGRAYDIAIALQKAFDAVGKIVFRANVRLFYEIVDECWGVRSIEVKANVAQVNSTFLFTLACVFADHTDFWTGERSERFTISRELRTKLKSFPITDPTIVQLSSSGGTAPDVLYDIIVRHINKGKRTNHLSSRRKNTTA